MPVKIMSTFAISSAQIFGRGEPIKSAEQLKGKRVTAIVAGLWRVTEAQIFEKFGLRSGKDCELVTVPNLLTGITQALAGTADYALGWETDATLVTQRYPELKVVLESADMRPPEEDTHIQVYGSRTTMAPETEKKLIAALGDMTAMVYKDLPAVDARFVKWSGLQANVFSCALESGRYKISIHKPNDKEIEAIKADLVRISADNKTLPDDFFK